jgi:hypothetical protein
VVDDASSSSFDGRLVGDNYNSPWHSPSVGQTNDGRLVGDSSPWHSSTNDGRLVGDNSPWHSSSVGKTMRMPRENPTPPHPTLPAPLLVELLDVVGLVVVAAAAVEVALAFDERECE